MNNSVDSSHDGAVGCDYTEEIPDECLASIFKFVDSVDRKSCSAVCHRWLRVEAESRRRLSINGEAKLFDIVVDLFHRFDSITLLTLRRQPNSISTNINDESLLLISLLCKNLTHLKLRRCKGITEIGMLALAKNGKSLKRLSCSACMFGIKGIHAVIDNSTVLEELSVSNLGGKNDDDDTDSFTPSGGINMNSCCKKLKTLKIVYCLGDWDAILVKIGKLNLGLIEVRLEGVKVSDVGLGGVSNCLKLEALYLMKTSECSDAGLCEVAENCKMLKRLHIHDGWNWGSINRIGDDGLISVAKHCVNLKELILMAMRPTSLSLTAIASSCLSLEIFALSLIDTVRDSDIECIAAKCVGLKMFIIERCSVSNAAIQAFASGSPNLVKVMVINCPNITADVLQWLREKRGSLTFNVKYIHEITDDAQIDAQQ